MPAGTRVSIQIGPAVNGTALRDAVGFITFGQFLNQVQYADAGTALNNEVKQELLADLDVPLVALRTFDASQQACLACDPVSQPHSLQPAMSARRRLAAVAVPGRNRDAFGF